MSKPEDDHAGSGIDKPKKRSILQRIIDDIKDPITRADVEKRQTGNGKEQRIPRDQSGS